MSKSPKKGTPRSKQVSVKATDKLAEVLHIMDAENLEELEICDGPFQVKLVRQSAAPHFVATAHTVSASAPKKQIEQEDAGHTPIKSPLAGIFYRSPSPSAAPFVKEGDTVTPDKTLCIIEAMKVLNEINAGVSGRIIKIMVENGKPVQAGQTICLVESA